MLNFRLNALRSQFTHRFGIVKCWSLTASGMLTWTRRPPSSTPRTRNWVFRALRSCSSTSCCPSRRSAAPGTGSLCTWRPASESGSCSVCLRATWGWFCAETRRPRSGTESAGAPGRSPGPAGSAAPRTTGCCSDWASCPASPDRDQGCSRCHCCHLRTSCCASSSWRSVSAAAPAPPRSSPDYPQGRPGSWNPLPFLSWRNVETGRKTRCPPSKPWLQNKRKSFKMRRTSEMLFY